MVASPPKPITQTTGDKRVTLHGLTWDAYQQILDALPQSRAARLTYDRGTLEIASPQQGHAFAVCLISRFIHTLVVETGMELKTMGSTTINRKALNRSAEPDSAFYIQNQPLVVGRIVDFDKDPPPDLLLEIDITPTDINKNQFYAAIGVPEFWRYNGQEWSIFQLQNGTYQECTNSPTFEWVEKEDLYRFLKEAWKDEMEAQSNLQKRSPRSVPCF